VLLGALHMLIGAALLLAGGLALLLSTIAPPPLAAFGGVSAYLSLALGAYLLLLGWGLAALRPWAWGLAVLTHLLSLLAALILRAWGWALASALALAALLAAGPEYGAQLRPVYYSFVRPKV